MKKIILIAMFLAMELFATGPRITSNFISPDRQEIFALDLPPFISTEVKEDGVLSAIIKHIAAEEKMDLLVTVVPLHSMMKYYLTQENALGIMGRHLGLSSADKSSLIEIPLFLANENFVYYKSANNKTIHYEGKLSSLTTFTYGASKGETTSKYKDAGIKVKKGRALSLFKKLKNGSVDFISFPSQSTRWFLEKNFAKDKENFKSIEHRSKSVSISLYFNSKHLDGKKNAQIFKKSLLKMLDNGKYADILKTYVQENKEIKNQIKFIRESLQ